MPKKFFKRFTPATHKIKEHKYLKFFGEWLHNENLWHVNKYSVSRAFGIGLFAAFIPIPFQMVLAAALAIAFHANLPISVALVWLTNPLTMPPIFYSTYKLGALIMGVKPTKWTSDFSLQWLTTELTHIWKPLFLGSFIVGLIAAFLGFVLVRILWRLRVMSVWRRRKG